MMIEEFVEDRTTMAGITGGRVEFYRVLVEIFGNLPDTDLVARIKQQDFENLLKGCRGIEDTRLDSGVHFLKSYELSIKGKPDGEILDELSVDRTRILRGTGMGHLRPPYEGLYRRTAPKGATVLELRAFYRKAGLSADDAMRESPDYLCVELDFMRAVCLREQNQWSSGANVAETVAREEQFLREHLGSWVGEFCQAAEHEALTEFYRGFLVILDAFVGMDGEYVRALLLSFKG